MRLLDRDIIHPFHDAPQCIASRRLHVDADDIVIILQDIIGTFSDDDAGLGGGKFFDDDLLIVEKLVIGSKL